MTAESTESAAELAAQEYVNATFKGESLADPPKYPAELVWGMVHKAHLAGQAERKVILVRIENHYGNVRVYPAGPAAQAFADIAGQVTLTPYVVRTLRALGYGVRVTNGSPELPAEYGA
jgi:hypothetical protein